METDAARYADRHLTRRTLLRAGLALGAAGGAGLATDLGADLLGPGWGGVPAHAATPAWVTISAEVATVWLTPTSPRAIDALAIRPEPDIKGWLRRLDAQPGNSGRFGLHGRVDTQVRRGEPVLVARRLANGWTQVHCPWQPIRGRRYGILGWVAPGQVSNRPWTGRMVRGIPAIAVPAAPPSFVTGARTLTGVSYLWDGTTSYGVDCSGLVLYAARRVGVQVPRHARDQQRYSTKVALSAVRPGDLYFFARPGAEAHHVGIVTRRGWMLNAASTGTRVREERITGKRLATLVGAGRFAGLS